jgi:ketosteroid isomerase-like protein
MSEENVERVRAALEAYHRGDVDEALTYIDRESELRSAIIGGAEGNVYRGHKGYRHWYTQTFERFERARIDVTEWRDIGDRVVLLGRLRATVRESGARIDTPTGWVFTLRDGMVVKQEGFLSHSEALEAAGLSE